MATKIKKYCNNHPDIKAFCKKLCKSCYIKDYQAKRRLIIAKLDPKKRSELRKQTDQRHLLKVVYKILCAELKPLHRCCEANLPGCQKIANEIHHAKGRRGILLIMSIHFKYLCSSCHSWLNVHSREAKEMGLSLPINSNTDYIFTDREIELIKKYNLKTPKSVNIT